MVGLVEFYGISTLMGYLMPNSVYTYCNGLMLIKIAYHKYYKNREVLFLDRSENKVLYSGLYHMTSGIAEV